MSDRKNESKYELTLSQTTNFRFFQIEKAFRR